ncbi:hypothetical protein V490_07571 [Pseudogymnoascus sp. VKM F-3557]|nr:hypothetical protein V490_07571 [Pseudogymnoascus sp. VKM F-3557]
MFRIPMGSPTPPTDYRGGRQRRTRGIAEFMQGTLRASTAPDSTVALGREMATIIANTVLEYSGATRIAT